MRLTDNELKFFLMQADEMLQQEKLQDMKKYIQHGNTNTYTHCMAVSYYSYLILRRLPLKLDAKSVIRGAMLHDFYLYDWHLPRKSPKLHGFAHPALALKNSRKYFRLNRIEENIIEKHMWPLTLTRFPTSREAFLVCMVDKLCSLTETLYMPLLPRKDQRLKHLFE